MIMIILFYIIKYNYWRHARKMTITIERRLPVINGYVSIPDDQVLSPTSLTVSQAEALIPGSYTIKMGGVTRGRLNGGRASQEQTWFVLPAYNRLNGPASDYFKTLRDNV